MSQLSCSGRAVVATADGRRAPVVPNRFPRSARLLRSADFESVYKRGRRHFGTHMTVFYQQRPQGEGARVGFTVARKLGIAVERNRMKRRLREAVRLQPELGGIGVDIVINPKRSLLTAEFPAVRNEIGRAWEVIRRTLRPEKSAVNNKEISS